MKLLLTGFTQVFFVANSTYFISTGNIAGIFISAFAISLIWSWNVKKISISNNIERFYYSLGAAFGSLFGYLFAKFVSIL